MIEKPPSPTVSSKEAMALIANPKYSTLFEKISREYLYWDKVKYLAPAGVKAETLWQAVSLQRGINARTFHFGKYAFRLTLTETMLNLLHELDWKLTGHNLSGPSFSDFHKKFYLVSSLMEEAIASSQMEGASTTRKVAKDMLRKQQRPKDKSQQMILNNYNTIQYISSLPRENLSIERILDLHRLITERTLGSIQNEGHLRTSDDIVVMDAITGQLAHVPPSYKELKALLKELCGFVNSSNPADFIHPIVKSIILHFLLAFIHPFTDGNGRTSRSLVYWYLMEQNYEMVKYLSISRIIYRNKKQYEKSFLYTENDHNDLSYFILFNLNVLKKAYEEMERYLQKKSMEQVGFFMEKKSAGITQRQAAVLKLMRKSPANIVTAKEVASCFGITEKTARADLKVLALKKLITLSHLNKRKIGYSCL